ncbi:uncharacterized protein LOC141574267 [Camelus bactrianus]|uniref:Uncharacterized protein LOC141574267 n=1 Tax=Camelus bactrianus TaxID=9837 RepID=A0AC58P4X7_CAMBA
MLLRRRQNCPELEEAGHFCSGSRGRRWSGDWAAACHNLRSRGRAGPDRFRSAPLATSRAAGAPARGSALAAGEGGARTHAWANAPARTPELPGAWEAGCSCSGSLGRRRSGDWAAAGRRLRCRRRAGPDRFRSSLLATSRAAGAPARGSALPARGGEARTHARSRRRRCRICLERGEAGRSCSGSRGRRRSGDWAAACCRLHCCRRAGGCSEVKGQHQRWAGTFPGPGPGPGSVPHLLTRFDHHSVGPSAVSCGSSGKQLKRRHNSQPGMLPDSWSRMVKSLNVSSSVNQASRLVAGSAPSWPSSGSQGKMEIP